jgi:hypothetical protein
VYEITGGSIRLLTKIDISMKAFCGFPILFDNYVSSSVIVNLALYGVSK